MSISIFFLKLYYFIFYLSRISLAVGFFDCKSRFPVFLKKKENLNYYLSMMVYNKRGGVERTVVQRVERTGVQIS